MRGSKDQAMQLFLPTTNKAACLSASIPLVQTSSRICNGSPPGEDESHHSSMLSTTLCSSCRLIVYGTRSVIVPQPEDALYPPEHERHAHHETVESLLAAVEQGCVICMRFRIRLGDVERNLGSRTLTRSLATQRKQGRGWCTTWVLMRPADFGDEETEEATSRMRLVLVANRSYFANPTWLALSFVLIPLRDLKPPLTPAQHLETTGQTTTSAAPWAHARNWYAKCTGSHAACRVQDPNFLPTRLLEVGSTSSTTVKLIICADMLQDCHSNSNKHCYATLSHCWGGANVPTLTVHTINTLLDGISINSLPKTFAEAIVATRTMGIAYIWIDSLCIVQDSPEDWAAEAGIMGDVYSNSTLNIMATASRNSHGGLGRGRDARFLQPIVVNSTVWPTKSQEEEEEGEEDNAQLAVPATRWHLAEEDLWKTSVHEQPLNTRGWVLQERVLSARALHFGSEQLLWECRCLSACEMYPDGLPGDLLDNVDRIKPLDQTRANITGELTEDTIVLRNVPQDGLSADELLRIQRLRQAIANHVRKAKYEARFHELDSIWSNWIQAYSAANLTHRSDKMIALSGLAKEMRSLRDRGDRYLAGLWRRGLVDQLLWHAIHPDETKPISRTVPSPARIGTGIPSWSWASVDTEVVPGFAVDERRFLVTSHVQVLDVTTFPLLNGDETATLDGGELRFKCSMVSIGTVSSRTVHVNGVGKISGIDLHLDEMLRNSVSVVFVPVITTRGKATAGPASAEVSILILPSAVDKPQGYYRRIGLLTYEYDLEDERRDVKILFGSQIPRASLFLDNASDVLIIV